MVKHEIAEIKKLFTQNKCSITRICGCYVDGEKNKKTELKEAFLALPEEEMFKYFESKYPEKLKVNLCYSEELSHKIYAGCDAFLMPSLFEPCGLSQLMSLRYGTLPIVRETGGLRDTVIPYNNEKSTGFSFSNYNAHDMLYTIRYAQRVFEDKKEWEKIVKRAMKADFSWKSSAKEYEKLYDQTVE